MLKPRIKWIGIIAVVVVIVAGLVVWVQWSPGLYKKYAISREMSVAGRGGDRQADLNKAAELYNDADYAGARKILQALYMENPQNPLLSYYFSITLIEAKQEYEARTVLMKLYEGDSAYKYDAAYYIALSFIKENNKQLAMEWLEKIPQENASYNEARELITKLK